jgi:hypothetical protein
MRPLLRWSLLILPLIATTIGAPARLAAPESAGAEANSRSCRPFFDNHFYATNNGHEYMFTGLAAGDFNGDGFPDLAGNRQDRLSILLGTAQGKFREGPDADNGGAEGFMVAGDFNGDGRLDLAISSKTRINILLGNGDGTFRHPKPSPSNMLSTFMVTADFNGDGRVDIASVGGITPNLQVSLGRGDGTFQDPVMYATGDASNGIAVADFDGNGTLEVAVTNFSHPIGSEVSVLPGNGDGSFGPKVDYRVRADPTAVVAADFNEDGKPDLAVAGYLGGTVEVFRGRGNGTFRKPDLYQVPTRNSLWGLAAFRFAPGDRIGLAATGTSGTYVFVNNGRGKFRPAMGYNPASLLPVVADFNRDGRMDLAFATGQYLNDSIGVLYGKGDGFFATSNAYPSGQYDVTAAAVGDFNGDGKRDLAVGTYNSLGIMLSEGQGRFGPVVHSYPISPNLFGIAVGDLNGDGKLDVATSLSGGLTVFLGKGDGAFAHAGDFPLSGVGEGRPRLADLNGDGILDVEVSADASLDVLLGKGDGTFAKPVAYASGRVPYSLLLADFNRDGKLDIAFNDGIDPAVGVLLGNGDGTFQNEIETATPQYPLALASSDFDLDGHPDLIVPVTSREGDSSVLLLLGNGDGTFRVSTAFSGFFRDIAAADFNGDGKPDVLAMSGEVLLHLMIGNGDGSFRMGETTYMGTDFDANLLLTLSDLNHDHAIDVLLPSHAGTVGVLLNHCGQK